MYLRVCARVVLRRARVCYVCNHLFRHHHLSRCPHAQTAQSLSNNVQVRAHKKRTVSHDTRCHGLEVLLLLVKSQRGILCWVAPNTSPYGGVDSHSFLELLKKTPERGLLRSALIRRPLVVCSHHMRIAQLMTMPWIKSE